MFSLRPARASALLELVIAFAILSIIGIAASVMINSSMSVGSVVKQEFIATNLAREGLEGIKNIIETNWMKFSSDRAGCWIELPGNTACTGADILTVDETKYYRISFAPDSAFNWILVEGTEKSDMATATALTSFGNYQLIKNSTFYQYVTGTASSFYRQIIIKYLDKDASNNINKIQVTSTVSWMNKTRKQNVTLVTNITNYLE